MIFVHGAIIGINSFIVKVFQIFTPLLHYRSAENAAFFIAKSIIEAVPLFVIPAKAGVPLSTIAKASQWIPAFAGMTEIAIFVQKAAIGDFCKGFYRTLCKRL
ncbi:MAG: hypothetical protein CO093_00200 [Alphaproteobacteria bacterium CG_4_9_14_3_um_filter_47_13]|nr:MAG: hypothetical protein CO093_00200 [Alphaproteobacteria bacterium CG_4_9_14_3_um_filter_47_13]